MSLSRELAQGAAMLEFSDLPPEVVHAAKISLADGLAVMLAASRLEPAATPFADHAVALGGAPEATLIGRSERTSAPLAAFANGALAHAIDFEDTFDATGVHPNAVVIPAVLALAERERTSGEDILVALATGCDAVCRLSLAMRSDPAKRGWYFPPILGAIGATLACARLLQLPAERYVDALSLAACQFALTDELKRSPDSDLRAIRDSFAARAAVEAVLLAQRGVRGVDLPLEGESGVFATLTGLPPDASVLLDGWGKRFHGPSVSLKLWPSCRGTHSAIAAGLALRDEGLSPDEVASAVFDVTPPDDMLLEPVVQRQFPRTAIDAKFSIPFTFATALVSGSVGLADFEDRAIRDARRLAVAQRVRLGRIVSDAPRFSLELAGGRTRSVALQLPPPMLAGLATPDQIRPKLQACLAATGAADKTDGLLHGCLDIEQLPLNQLALLLSA